MELLSLNTDPVTSYRNAVLPDYYPSSNTKNVLYLDTEKICFSPDGRTWSEDLEVTEIISLPNPPIHINCKETNTKYSFVVEQSGGKLQYWRTNIIRIHPAFFVYNNTSKPILFKQHIKYNPSSTVIEIPEFSRLPIHFSLEQKDRFDFMLGLDNSWSTPLSAVHCGYFQVLLGGNKGVEDSLNVEIALHDLKTFIVVNESRSHPLYTFENKTNYSATLYGQNVLNSPITVEPNSTTPIGWIQAQDELKLSFRFKNITTGWESSENKLNFGKITHKTCKGDSSGGIIDIRVLGVGFTKNVVCVFKSDMQDTGLDKIPVLDLKVLVDSLTLTVIDDKPQEFINVTISNIDVKFKEYPELKDLNFTIGELQVDNQLMYSKSPIIIYAGAKKDTDGSKFFSLELQIDTSAKGLKSYPNFEMKLEPIMIHLDLTLLTYLIAYSNWVIGVLGSAEIKGHILKTMEGENFNLLTYKPESIANSSVVYFQQFMISAIKVSLTLTTDQNISDLDVNYLTAKDIGIANALKNYARVELHDSTIQVKPLNMNHIFATPEQFGENILAEYKVQLIFQAVRLIGGKVVSAIASGAGAVVYSPINAALFITGKKSKFNAVKNAQTDTNKENTALHIIKKKKVDHRKRTPRYFDKSGHLLAWDDIETNSMMLNLEDGAYSKVDIMFFSKLTETTALMITFGSILFLTSGPGRLCPWKLSEEIPHHKMIRNSIVLEETKITFSCFHETNFIWAVIQKNIAFLSKDVAINCFNILRTLAVIQDAQLLNKNIVSTNNQTKSDTVRAFSQFTKGVFTETQIEISEPGKLKTKKKLIDLPGCYVSVDTKKYDSWIIVDTQTKEVCYFKCKNLKDVEDWITVCIANGASSYHFST